MIRHNLAHKNMVVDVYLSWSEMEAVAADILAKIDDLELKVCEQGVDRLHDAHRNHYVPLVLAGAIFNKCRLMLGPFK